MRNYLIVLLLLICSSNIRAQQVLWTRTEAVAEGAITNTTDIYGNSYITGTFNQPTLAFGSFILTDSSPIYRNNMFIVKYYPLGNVLWAQASKGKYDEIGKSIATDSAGNVYVAGIYNSDTAFFGYTRLINANNPASYLSYDIFLVKYDSSGHVIWGKTFGGRYDDRVNSVAVDPTGNVYITGYYGSDTIRFGTTLLSNAAYSNTDIFLAKLDTAGNVLWANGAGGFYNESANTVKTDPEGNVYIAGAFSSAQLGFTTDTLNNDTVQTNDAFIAKYRGNGSFVWAKEYGGNHNEEIFSISVDRSSNVIAVWNFNSYAMVVDTATYYNSDGSGYYTDMFLLKLDSAGNRVWGQQLGQTYNDLVDCVTTDTAGYIYFSGIWQGSATLYFGSIPLSYYSGNTSFLAKYSPLGLPVWATQGDDRYQSWVSWGPISNLYLSYSSGIFIANHSRIADTTILLCIDPPVAAFTASSSLAAVTFVYSGSMGGLDSVHWVFGDGASGHGVVANHTYDIPGTYHACATAYTLCGTDTFCMDVTTTCAAAPPYSAFTVNSAAMPDISFTYSGTIVSLDSVTWNFGDGGTYTGLAPHHTYATTGIYHVCARMYSPCGNNSFCQDVYALGTGVANYPIITTTIFPNPVSNELHIDDVKQDASYRILNVVGTCVANGNLQQGNNTVAMHSLITGIYVLELIGADGTKQSVRLTKE